MGLNFRLMKLNPNFQHMNKNHLIEAYRQSSKRLIFLDYEVLYEEKIIKNYKNFISSFIFLSFYLLINLFIYFLGNFNLFG